MGTFIREIGHLTIPEDKRDAFLADAKIVAEQGGLMESNHISVFGKNLDLLSSPDFSGDEDGLIDFGYNYYENSQWENAGINIHECIPYSGKVGSRHFNKAVQALYILAELYSETSYVSVNDSNHMAVETIQWLRYVLKRELHYTWRNRVWELVETMAQEQVDEGIKPQISPDFITNYSGDEPDPLELVTAASVLMELKDFIRQEERPALNNTISFGQALTIFHDEVLRLKKSSTRSENDQITFLLRLLSGLDGREEEDKEIIAKNFAMAISCVLLPAPTCVKIITDIYGRDFWDLWLGIKSYIHEYAVQPEVENKPLIPYGVMSTNEFFCISDEDRLYWWRKDGDVHLDEDLITWIISLQVRYKAIRGREHQGSIGEWQRRFVNLLADYPDVPCFETMFFEFMGNFKETMFRAAVVFMEEVASDRTEYRRLMSIMGNKSLRYGIFFF